MKSLLLFFFALTIGFSYTPIRVIVEGKLESGIYWSDMMIGTPAQQVRMHLDTGSNLLVLEKTDCTGCSHYLQGYSPDSSSTSLAIDCSSSLCGSNTCNNYCLNRTVCLNSKCCARLNNTLCAFYVAYGDGSTAEGGLYRDFISLPGYNDTRTPEVKSTIGLVL